MAASARRRIALVGAALVLLACWLSIPRQGGAGAGSVRGGEKKLIYHGWNTRDTAYVREHWREMEQMPFDGVAISVAIDRAGRTIGDGSTGNLLGWQIFGARRFEPRDFAAAMEDLKTPRWSRFTDNFLPAAIATRDQDQGLNWFDDTRWATIESNWRLLATLARAGGGKGILLDPEHYDYECELFCYRHHRAQRAARPFSEYTAQARERGRQLGAAARAVFPEITIASLYGYTLALDDRRRHGAPEQGRYALLPAFFDGLLEGAGPAASLVDLGEFSAGYTKRSQFDLSYETARETARALSGVPELYGRQVRAGFGLAIDYRSDQHPWDTAAPERNYFSPARFRDALRAALACSDRYVWIYSEDGPEFFPRQRLPEAYVQAMRDAREVAP